MAYYSADYGYLYLQRDIKAKLDHKDGAAPQYICYCHEITYAMLKHAVEVDGIRSVKALFRKKPILMERCKKENPFGCSCLPDIQRQIELYIL